jgi:molybdopterin-guanine dinucleotide biosynthesis protein A
MMDWPLRALAAVCPRVAVVCKADTELPALPSGVERWNEPEEPSHPLTGIVFALGRARADVLVCAADMPFVRAGDLRALLSAADDAPGAAAVVAHAGGRLQPTLAVYRAIALQRLGEAVAGAPLTRTVEGLEPVRVSLAEQVVRSVNTPAQLAAAETELAGLAWGRLQ